MPSVAYLILESYLLLVQVDFLLEHQGFQRLHEAVSSRRARNIADDGRIPCQRICRAMDLACVFYPKTVLCLQRSAATVFLLRRHGWSAQLVTGCALGIYENHAWAELGGVIVNDKPYIHEMYQVLDRC